MHVIGHSARVVTVILLLVLAACSQGSTASATAEQKTAARAACIEYLDTTFELVFVVAFAGALPDDDNAEADAQIAESGRTAAAAKDRCEDPGSLDAVADSADPDAVAALSACQELVRLAAPELERIIAGGGDHTDQDQDPDQDRDFRQRHG